MGLGLSLDPCRGENLYLRAGATGSDTGADWHNAWSSVSRVVWGPGTGKLGSGDTLWVAGGIYGTLDPGTEAGLVSAVEVKRARSDAVESYAAAGWSAAFDSRVTIEIVNLDAAPKTYFIDYVAGNDNNEGISTNAPWKRHPYMPNFAGLYIHTAGDRFIFKGGVTWPKETLPVVLQSGGSGVKPDYYGVDVTWFAGANWTRPVWDGEGAVPKFLYLPKMNNVVFDNLEMTRLSWAGAGFGAAFFVSVDTSTNVVIQNSLFHNWSHGSYAAGARDDLVCVLGNGNPPYNAGCVITNCTFDGSPGSADSGAACYQWPVVRNSVARNMANGFLMGRSPVVGGCNVGPINDSFDPGQHENGIETLVGGVTYITNNVVHDTTAVTILCGGGGIGETDYVFNNVVYNSLPIPLQIDTQDPFCTVYVFNNTLVSGANQNCVRVIDRGSGPLASLILRNNHFVTSGAPLDVGPGVNSLTNNFNVTLTAAQAAAHGYSVANRFAPVSATNATVNVGVDASALVVRDINGVSRPQGGDWDAGAYEFVVP